MPHEEASEFVALWLRHADHLHQLCLSWTGGRIDLADEALARARARALEKHAARAQELTDPHAWLRKLTYHVCVDLHREIKRRAEESLEELDYDFSASVGLWAEQPPDPEQLLISQEQRECLRSSVRRLAPGLRQVALLHCYRELSYREIAGALGISEANVRKRMQLVRTTLRAWHNS